MQLAAIVIDIASAFLVVCLGATILLRQHRSELRRALLATHGALLLFICGDLGTLVAEDLAAENAALAILYGGTMSIPPCLLLLSVAFADSHDLRPRWLPGWAPRLAFALAFTFWAAAATNPWHGQFLTPVLGGRNEHHWLWWIASSSSYVTVSLAFGICVWLGIRRRGDPATVRQATVLCAAMAVPIAANFLYNLTAWSSSIDPTVLAFSVTVTLVALGVYGLGLFGLSPVSTREALLASEGAVLVVDPQGRERIANAALRGLLGFTSPPPTVDAVERLAACLEHPESGETVSRTELWAIANAIPEKRTGALYRARGDGTADESWFWVTAVPIRSRWREVAAYCFRATDVTAMQSLRRDNAALIRWASEVNDSYPSSARMEGGRLSQDRTRGTTDWRREILRGLEHREILTIPVTRARVVSEVLGEIAADSELVARFERSSPEEIWREFERRVSERGSRL